MLSIPALQMNFMSNINWFPGHMHKAIKEIREILPKVDLIIEVIDSRIPYSSSNPVIDQFRADKPCIKLMSKSDLSDPAVTQLWLDHFRSQTGVGAIAVTTQQPEEIRSLIGLCKNITKGRENALGTVTALITGIPNVGKSTIINTLAGKVIAKTGNEPAITQRQQRIDLHNGLILVDSPGILWPKIENPRSGERLAITGAIKETAMSPDEVAVVAAAYLAANYPEQIKQRYKLAELPGHEQEVLEAIGRVRGCLAKGGVVDMPKVSRLLLTELREGTLGRISLETPEMAVAEELIVQQMREEKARREEEKRLAKKKGYKPKLQD